MARSTKKPTTPDASLWQNRIVRTVDVPIGDLLENPKNWREHSEAQRRATAESIALLGMVKPLIVQDGTNLLIDGHLRLDIARQQMQPTVLVSYVDVTDLEADQMLAILDTLSNMAGRDDDLFAALLESVPDEEGTHDLYQALVDSYQDDATRTATEARGGKTDPDDAPDVPDDPTSKLGDLYILGEHRLLCGDSTNAEHVRRLMNGERSRLMPTDPPYLVNYSGGNHPQSWANKPEVREKHWDDYKEGETDALFIDFIRVALAEALTDRPAIYQFYGAQRHMLVETAWIENKLLYHQQIIWFKARPVLGRGHYMWQHEPCMYGWVKGNIPDLRPPANAKTVWEINQQGESDGIHPTQKPTELIRRMIDYHTEEGDVVYEPFGGSGTAIIAATQLNRRCYTMELSPAFVDVIVKRWEEFTGETAVLAKE